MAIASYPAVPADARLGIVLLALAMGGFSIGTNEFAAMTLVPYFSRDLGVNEATASHAISAYAFGAVLGAPVIAVLAARFSRRALLIGLMAMYGLANVAAALAPTFALLVGARFLSGLPHGAYFGVASLVAASLVPAGRRTWAVSMVMVGLTVATVAGVPLSSFLGQSVGWRWGFALVGLLSLATMALILRHAPADRPDRSANPLRELSALANRRVWMTLAVAAIGFGGMFAVYTYVASTLLEVTRAPEWVVPLMFMVFGAGMVTGTLVVGRHADRVGLLRISILIQCAAVAMLLVYPFTVGSVWLMAPCLFAIGATGSLGLPLQTRLMDVAGHAQTLAAALNHSAFNLANALGPLFAAAAINRGYGFPSSGFVGAALALAGLGLLILNLWDDRRLRRAGGGSLQPGE